MCKLPRHRRECAAPRQPSITGNGRSLRPTSTACRNTAIAGNGSAPYLDGGQECGISHVQSHRAGGCRRQVAWLTALQLRSFVVHKARHDLAHQRGARQPKGGEGGERTAKLPATKEVGKGGDCEFGKFR